LWDVAVHVVVNAESAGTTAPSAGVVTDTVGGLGETKV
jgi:hypothetical protein